MEPYKEALKTANAKIDSPDKKVASQQITITWLSHEVDDLKIRNDDIEQCGWKGSARFFGIPENTQGSTDDKVFKVINNMIGIVSPITLDDLEVTHRVGRTANPKLADQPLLVHMNLMTEGGVRASVAMMMVTIMQLTEPTRINPRPSRPESRPKTNTSKV